MLKKILKMFICLMLAINFVLCSTISVIASEWYDNEIVWNENCRGARVSIWDVNSQRKINSIDILDGSFNECKKYRKVSNLTKPEVMALNYKLSDEILTNLVEDRYIEDNLCKESITLPEMFERVGKSEIELQDEIRNWFSDESNLKKILSEFNLSDNDYRKWNRGDLCLLFEPLFVVHSIYPKKDMWVVTCAELGILAYNGFTVAGQIFEMSKLASTGFKALPYGVYKKDDGILKSIKPYNSESKNKINTQEGFIDMIDSLGAFEVTVNNSVPISGYEEIETTSAIETEGIEETEIETTKEIELETVKETETKTSKEDETKIESEIELRNPTTNKMKDDIVNVTKNNKVADAKIVDFKNIFNKYRLQLLITLDIIVIIILLIIIIKELSNRNIKKKDDENLGIRNEKKVYDCERTDCRYNIDGKCISEVVNKLHKECSANNDYYYFDEK